MADALGGAAASISEAGKPIGAVAGLTGPLVGVAVATGVLAGVRFFAKAKNGPASALGARKVNKVNKKLKKRSKNG